MDTGRATDESLVNSELNSNETKLHNNCRQKTWDGTVTKDSWMIFKVMC